MQLCSSPRIRLTIYGTVTETDGSSADEAQCTSVTLKRSRLTGIRIRCPRLACSRNHLSFVESNPILLTMLMHAVLISYAQAVSVFRHKARQRQIDLFLCPNVSDFYLVAVAIQSSHSNNDTNLETRLSSPPIGCCSRVSTDQSQVIL